MPTSKAEMEKQKSGDKSEIRNQKTEISPDKPESRNRKTNQKAEIGRQIRKQKAEIINAEGHNQFQLSTFSISALPRRQTFVRDRPTFIGRDRTFFSRGQTFFRPEK